MATAGLGVALLTADASLRSSTGLSSELKDPQIDHSVFKTLWHSASSSPSAHEQSTHPCTLHAPQFCVSAFLRCFLARCNRTVRLFRVTPNFAATASGSFPSKSTSCNSSRYCSGTNGISRPKHLQSSCSSSASGVSGNSFSKRSNARLCAPCFRYTSIIDLRRIR